MDAYTIDSRNTRDRDDAIWIEEHPEGGWLIRVVIADVATTVPRGSQFDITRTETVEVDEGEPEERTYRGAYERVSTRYYAGGSSPMLPRFLSEGSLSLHPGQVRQAGVIELHLDEDLHLYDFPTVRMVEDFKSKGAVAFSEVPRLMTEGPEWLQGQLTTAARIADALLTKRREAGALALCDLNNGWVTDESGFLRKLETDDSTIGYVIVQELMVLANSAVAALCAENGVPILYRNHRARAHAPERKELMRQLADIELQGMPADALATLSQRIHMILERADYGVTLEGHYGLNLPAYGHFSSPIRRYADLVNWRQLKAWVTKGELPYTMENLIEVATHINEVVDERRESRAAYLKAKAIRGIENKADRTGLLALSIKEFDRIVKLAVRGGSDPTPELVEGFAARMAEGTVSHLAMEVVLIESKGDGWGPLRQVVGEHLVTNPPLAITLLGLAEQVSGWPAPRYQAGSSGPSHRPSFTASASIKPKGGSKTTTRSAEGATKKLARQRACVRLLAAVTGFELPDDAEGWKATKKPPAPKAKVKALWPAEVTNPVGALQEYCQKQGLPLPDYDYGRDGDDHLPIFTCTVTHEGQTATATGSDKPAAKRRAAGKMVDLLRAPLEDPPRA